MAEGLIAELLKRIAPSSILGPKVSAQVKQTPVTQSVMPLVPGMGPIMPAAKGAQSAAARMLENQSAVERALAKIKAEDAARLTNGAWEALYGGLSRTLGR